MTIRIFRYLQKTIVSILNRFINKIEQVNLVRQKRQVIDILSSTETPHSYDSEVVFERLQEAFKPRCGYGYDSFSTWQRGVQRVQKLMERFEYLRQPGKSVLEIGCGDGMTGHTFSVFGHDVELVDMEDWRDSRANNLPFNCNNMSQQLLPFDSDYYDFVYSFNTFEHLDDPEATLKEIVRVCKSHGYIYIEFGPLYACPWGLHAYRSLTMPYSQFLFSDKFITRKLNELGIFDLGEEKLMLQPLNKWTVKDFMSLWDLQECKVVWSDSSENLSHLNIIIEYSKAFTGRGLKIDDVTTHSLYVAMVKE